MMYAERAAGQRQRGALAFALLLFGAFLYGAPALAADAFSTDWAPAAKSDARLVAAGGALAGFEIRLAPNAITYWRDPGESGVPPTFDFSASQNVASAEVDLPAYSVSVNGGSGTLAVISESDSNAADDIGNFIAVVTNNH